jgi:glycerol kinase
MKILHRSILGISQYTDKRHIARATLEAVAFQTREIFEAMKSDSHTNPPLLLVDGGMTASQVFLQIQADLLGLKIGKKKKKNFSTG